MSASEEQIPERAYQLWDEAGRPQGRDREFWEQARRQIEDAVRDADPGRDTKGR